MPQKKKQGLRKERRSATLEPSRTAPDTPPGPESKSKTFHGTFPKKEVRATVRTRIFNHLTAKETEEYFSRGGDTVFIPLGVTEVHGELPLDCETVLAEGFCVALAEKADGLVLANLPYFYPGGTVISNGTVHIRITEGIEYLTKLCHSLIDQGFRRIFLFSGHGPAALTAETFCRDFFERTLIHPVHLGLMPVAHSVLGGDRFLSMPQFDSLIYGAYKIMGQMEYLRVDAEAAGLGQIAPAPPEMDEFQKKLGPVGGRVSWIFEDPAQHGGGYVFKDEEERLRVCTEGEAFLRKIVAGVDIAGISEAMKNYQAYAQRVSQKYPRIKTER